MSVPPRGQKAEKKRAARESRPGQVTEALYAFFFSGMGTTSAFSLLAGSLGFSV
jgi:hypothetical protein